MSPALLDPPGTLLAEAPAGACPGGRQVTLEERLQAVWDAAQRDGPADCPLCQAPMRGRGAAAQCDGCGARLS